MYSLTKKCIAEFIGTFVLVFFAAGTAVVTQANVVATALAFGLVIVAMAYSIGNISGCHINPAVSIAMLFLKKLNVKEFIFYVLAQLLGAILGAAALYGICVASGVDITVWATSGYIAGSTEIGAILASFGLEIIMTFVFVYVICNVLEDNKINHMEGLIIGFTLTLVHLLGINLTGTSVNPARSFGPALMRMIFNGGSVGLEQVWLFIVAPLIGGLLAAIVFKYLHKKKDALLKDAELSDNK